MRTIALAVAAAIMLPLSALAQNVALVLTNDDYDRLPDVRSANSAQAASRALAEAGFEVTEVRDARRPAASDAISGFRRDLAEAERVVVLVAGHIVNDGDRSWLLTSEAERPDAFSVGAQGLPLAPILAMLSDNQGSSVILVADMGENLRLGPGLMSGFAPVDPPQGVTLIAGSARGILSVLRGDLLEPGRTLAETAANLPASVEAYGFLPRTIAFLTAPLPGEAPAESMPQALVEPDPRESAESIEAQLQLDRVERRSVQRDLELLGYDPRGIDGIFGPGTRASIRNWQEQNDFDPTGYLSGNQIALLQEQGARRALQLEAEAEARQAEQDRLDTAYWRESGAAGTEEGLRAYLDRFPDGLYADRARRQLEPFEAARREQAVRADRQAWDAAREEGTLEAYRDYLEGYPEGAFRREAEARIDALAPDRSTADAQAEEASVAGTLLVRLLVERRLEQLGADPGQIDGIFDEATRRAIRRFQRARDLPVTGYVTQATMARLLAG